MGQLCAHVDQMGLIGRKRSHDPQSGHLIGGEEPEGTSGRTEVTWFWGNRGPVGKRDRGLRWTEVT